jgi:hypothetical protein
MVGAERDPMKLGTGTPVTASAFQYTPLQYESALDAMAAANGATANAVKDLLDLVRPNTGTQAFHSPSISEYHDAVDALAVWLAKNS